MSNRIEYKTNDQIISMRKAGLLVAQALAAVKEAAKPGLTTAALDAIAEQVIRDSGGVPSFKGYYGFTGSICASVNEEVVHGIPGDRVLQPGDIISVDCGAILDGWHGDSAVTIILDPVDQADQALSDATQHSMWAGIAEISRAKHLGEVGAAIERAARAATPQGLTYGVIEEYVGHGIGSQMHQPPEVLNYDNGRKGAKLKKGMVLAVEPMLVRGDIQTKVLEDEWTVITADKSRASHWEHTVALHGDGIWVLTAEDGGAAGLEPFGVTPVALS